MATNKRKCLYNQMGQQDSMKTPTNDQKHDKFIITKN